MFFPLTLCKRRRQKKRPFPCIGQAAGPDRRPGHGVPALLLRQKGNTAAAAPPLSKAGPSAHLPAASHGGKEALRQGPLRSLLEKG